MLNFSEVVSDATDLVVEKMKKQFLVALNNAIQNNIELTKIYDPVFLYVMKYKNGFMQLPIRQWVNEKDNFGNTPLHQAAGHNSIEITKLLIDAGANLNIQNNEGGTPLHKAAKKNNKEVTKFLINVGADLNIQDNNGCTLLHYAACVKAIEIVKFLIAAGASLNIKDNNGYTPLHIAAEYHNIEIAKLLITAGADLNIQDNEGRTAEQYAETSEMRAVFVQARVNDRERDRVNYLNYDLK